MKAGQPLDRAALESLPLPPVVDGDKDTKGRILILAGSREVPGAALLTATAALRAGAGKPRIATGESIAPQVAVAMPEARVIALAERRDGSLAGASLAAIAEQANGTDAVVAGPGMLPGRSDGAILDALLASDAPLVLDAALLRSLEPARHTREPTPLLLPHAGELASLLDCDQDEIENDPIACGRRAAERFAAHVLVKGVTSHVVAADGRAWTYRGGAPGLGVSGSGDVLAGIVGGLLARGTEPLTALLWGVLLHGEAGEALARKVGQIGFLARELPAELPALMLR